MIPESVLWLLPGLFVLHDAEETLWLVGWLRQNRRHLESRFPTLFRRLDAHFKYLTRKAFAAMAAEELLVLLCATLYSSLTGDYYPWLALFLAFGLHLLVHLAQGVAVRGYFPALATSLCCLPFVGWMLWEVINSRLFTVREFVCCAVAGSLVAVLNLAAVHRVAAMLRR